MFNLKVLFNTRYQESLPRREIVSGGWRFGLKFLGIDHTVLHERNRKSSVNEILRRDKGEVIRSRSDITHLKVWIIPLFILSDLINCIEDENENDEYKPDQGEQDENHLAHWVDVGMKFKIVVADLLQVGLVDLMLPLAAIRIWRNY